MNTNGTGRWSQVAGVVLIAAAAAYTALNFEITTSITHFLPAGADQRLVRVSRAVAESELTRTLVLTVGAPDDSTAALAATELAQKLRQSKHVAWVQNGVGPDVEKAVYDLYFPRRLMFLSDHPEKELPLVFSDEGLRRSVGRLKEQLRLPTAPIVRRLAPEDPILAFPAMLERLKQAQSGGLELQERQFVTSGEESPRRGVLLLGSQSSPFDSTAQKALQLAIAEAFTELNVDHGGSLDLAQSGAGRFAIAAEASIKNDIARISIISSLGIVLLFLLFFRSLRSLALVGLPLAAGVVGGTAVGLLLFGRLHGLTLAFGSTLIGVCIDFAVHLQSHHALAPHESGPVGTLRRIWPALLLGALTTVAGLAGLAWTALPGIREIALFASTGVLCALASTRLLLPPLLPRKSLGDTAPLRWLSNKAESFFVSLRRRRWHFALLPAGSCLVCAIAFPALRWVDDVSAFQTLDPELQAEDERVRAQISRMESGRFVIAFGDTEEQALQRNDEVFGVLEQARADGVIGDFRSLHLFLPSAELQLRNRAQVHSSDRLFERTQRALASEGFRPDLFSPFAEAITSAEPGPLTYENLMASPLADGARPFRIPVGDQIAILTFLRQVNEPETLARCLDTLQHSDDIVYFDQLTFLEETYRFCRSRTLQLMIVGLIAVLLLLLMRYRRLGLALAAFAPSLLAAATTLALVSLSGTPATLLHLLGLLLVLSMGVDYGVFMVESRCQPQELAASVVSIIMACASTVLAFGLLALSANPALRALGLTTGIGVLLSLVLAPTALILVGKKGK